MQRFWVQSFPDPGRRRIKWRPADRVGYETKVHPTAVMEKERSRDRCIQIIMKYKRKRVLCLLATIGIFIPTLIYMSGSHSGGGFVDYVGSYVRGSGLTNGKTTQAKIFTSNGACLRPPQKVKLSVADRQSGTTGSVFSGNPVRSFPGGKVKFASFQLPTRSKATGRTEPWCERWAVVTTIMEPSETVRRQVRLKDWCLVIVADLKSLKTYETGWIEGEGNKAVVYLSSEDQKAMKDSFVEAIPWNHFGRKNIGYLYAIAHGASVIWDFDDDNMLKFWIPGSAPPGAPSIDDAILAYKSKETIAALEPAGHPLPAYNPYPILGAPSLPSWPRGVPLNCVKDSECSDTPLKEIKVSSKFFGVLQSLADYQPDVDALYRITMPIPFWFERSKETKPLMVPSGVLTPYNAQATLHFKSAFFALLLPVTVHGRVSDIWRSYFAQRLFWEVGLQFGFLARPLVVQDRNDHSNLADLNAEQDLYMKSEQLVQFLGEWKGKGATLVERMEQLWIALYERAYIDLQDVELMQLWVQSLLDAGYEFPSLVSSPATAPSNVVAARDDTEDDDSSCDEGKSLTFWTSDLHDGSRIDMPSVLSSLGQKVILAGHKKDNSPYPYALKMKGISVYQKLSPVINSEYLTHSTALTEDMIKRNFEFYKNDPKIASVDAFMCYFPPAMCELWMPFNKTIVYAPAHRYNLGRCSKEEWGRLDEHLYTLAAMNSPIHVIAASSVYDSEYLRHYTGLDPILLFSSSLFYTANNPYNPTRDEILVFDWLDGFGTDIQKFTLKDVRTLYPRYQLSDLVKHRAVVYMPHSVMGYAMTELYSLALPLFMPSMKFMQTIKPLGADRSSLSALYCKNPKLDKDIKPHPCSLHPYSPNVEAKDDPEAEYYWMQFADFFQWPHVVHFDDFKDLERKLEAADFNNIHKLMVGTLEQRKGELVRNWCKVINSIQGGRKVPKDYVQAIQKLYGVSRLQAS